MDGGESVPWLNMHMKLGMNSVISHAGTTASH